LATNLHYFTADNLKTSMQAYNLNTTLLGTEPAESSVTGTGTSCNVLDVRVFFTPSTMYKTHILVKDFVHYSPSSTLFALQVQI